MDNKKSSSSNSVADLSAVSNPTPAQRLKAETAQAHREVEKVFPVMASSFSLGDYHLLLRQLFPWHQALENQILRFSEWDQIDFNYSERLKTPALKADLNFFQQNPFPEEADHQENARRIQSLPQILGTLYVVEGSTLGGQIISKHLQEKFNLTEGGILHFSGYGAQTGVMWKRFQSLLNQHLMLESDLVEAIQAARQAFHSMGLALKSNSPIYK